MKKTIVLSAVVLALSATSLFAGHQTVRRRVKAGLDNLKAMAESDEAYH